MYSILKVLGSLFCSHFSKFLFVYLLLTVLASIALHELSLCCRTRRALMVVEHRGVGYRSAAHGLSSSSSGRYIGKRHLTWGRFLVRGKIQSETGRVNRD